MARTEIKVTILEDARVRAVTDEVGPAVHTSADRLLQSVTKELGGDATIEKRPHEHGEHTHTHRHTHKH